MSLQHSGFGVDVGGTAIKAARVDFATGEFIGPRLKYPTPQPATPTAICDVIGRIVKQANWDGPVGIALPGVIKGRRMLTAANVDSAWLDCDVYDELRHFLGDRKLEVLNDADAAGIAEVAYGTVENVDGPVLFLTLGTGIGSAFLLDGRVFANTELGHLIIDGREAEHFASSVAKTRLGLSFKQWAKNLTRVLREYEILFHPDAFIIGGGISQEMERWLPMIDIATPIYPAGLLNRAGIVGAALAAKDGYKY